MIDYDSLYQKAVYYNCKLNKKGKNGKVLSILLGAGLRLIYPCDISAFATISKNVRIPHAIGIVIGGTAIIKDDVTIMPNVVVGSKSGKPKSKELRHATIEKGCLIGANVTIIGPIIIGENSIIGSGATVTKSVPSNSFVIGMNEQRIIKNKIE